MTVHGRPSAVLIAPEDLERLEETLEIMRDAATMNRLAESDAELARGEYVSTEELAEVMSRTPGAVSGDAEEGYELRTTPTVRRAPGRLCRKPSRRLPTNSSPALS